MTEREQQIQKINDSLDYGIEQLHEAKKFLREGMNREAQILVGNARESARQVWVKLGVFK